MSVTAGVALAVADAVWAEIRSAGQASDEHLSILEALFGKNMVRACKILDEGGVRRVTGAPSGRSLFLCKHQLAARLAEAVSKHQDIEVTDEELAHMLAKL
ncbi:hypothetical protein OsJ_24966 [Oryza sativa Japonica Group]|uniref:Uncharacterized protein n=1 Tax=Oryza sativa subsp. japonica TaxID=39947 RepID=B9FY77_ORYSJ|nr:hypothetical protein OsJ_24966 [Oryza sativa Japonica Group]